MRLDTFRESFAQYSPGKRPEGVLLKNVLEKVANAPMTTLMAFFNLYETDPFARTLLYPEVPSCYIFKHNCFVRRKHGCPVPGSPGIKKDDSLERVYTVHPNNIECYHLRLLLHEVFGPALFACLKQVDGVNHQTFQSACRALGLLADGCYWNYRLQVAAVASSPV